MKLVKLIAIATLATAVTAGTADAQRTSRSGSSSRSARQAAPTAQARTTSRVQQPRPASQLGSATAQRARYLSAAMEGAIRQNATPAMQILANSGKTTLSMFESPHYKLNRTAKFNVSGLDKSGSLSLTALLPVSGHTGQANAAKWAKSNKYNIVIQHADGTRQTLPKVSASGFVTPASMSVKLKPGKTIIQAWADGSAGVAGYKAGREIELHWNGK